MNEEMLLLLAPLAVPERGREIEESGCMAKPGTDV